MRLSCEMDCILICGSRKACPAVLFVTINATGYSLSWPHDNLKSELALIPHTCLAQLNLKGAML